MALFGSQPGGTTRPVDLPLAAARRLRRIGARSGNRNPAAGPALRGGIVVLVGAGSADAFAALPAVSGWPAVAAERLRARDGRVGHEAVAVVAGSLAELRVALPWLDRAGTAAEVTLVVLETDRRKGLRAPDAVSGAEILRSAVTRTGSGLTVLVRLNKPGSVLEVARAALGGHAAQRCPRPGAGLRLGITAHAALPWAAGDRGARVVGARTPVARAAEHDLFDVLVGPSVHERQDPRVPRLAVTESPDGSLPLPPVDTVVVSPAGFRRAATGTGTVILGAGSATSPGLLGMTGACGEHLGGGDPRAGLTENHLAALRGLAGVEVRAAPEVDPGVLGRVLSQLACAGVPTRAGSLPVRVADALGAELAARLTALDLPEMADPGVRESWSVTTRRLALRRFAPDAYWRSKATELGKPAAPAPSVSVLLATRRAAYVPFALAQVQRQDWPDLEIVLVLHGVAASAEPVRAAVAACTRPLQVVEVGADVVFGQALNAGLLRCAGTLTTKMDDDDWYGPHHLTDLVLARGYAGATMVGLAAIELYLQGSDITARWSGRGAEAPETWLAGPTQLLETRDLRELGGWRATPGAVDWHLLRAVTAAGGTLYATHGLGFLYFRGGTHTWSPRGGDEAWLARSPDQRAGFDPPPQLDPLPHPALPA